MKKKTICPPEITADMVHNHMLNCFKDSEYPLLCVPFNNEFAWCRLKRLSMIDIKSCGDFSLIETEDDIIRRNNPRKKVGKAEITEYAELQHNICKAALIQPTYDEIMEVVLKPLNIDYKKIEEDLKKIEEQFIPLHNSKNVNDRKKAKELEEEYAEIELRFKYLMPADFLSYVMTYALSIDCSDIKKITEDILYNAAVSSKLAKNEPFDHVFGNFTDFNHVDINNRAWILYAERHKNKGA